MRELYLEREGFRRTALPATLLLIVLGGGSIALSLLAQRQLRGITAPEHLLQLPLLITGFWLGIVEGTSSHALRPYLLARPSPRLRLALSGLTGVVPLLLGVGLLLSFCAKAAGASQNLLPLLGIPALLLPLSSSLLAGALEEDRSRAAGLSFALLLNPLVQPVLAASLQLRLQGITPVGLSPRLQPLQALAWTGLMLGIWYYHLQRVQPARGTRVQKILALGIVLGLLAVVVVALVGRR